MSAYTSAECYRAGDEPPIITTHDLTVFVERILALDILQWDFMGVQLKFGQAIDQDERSAYEMEEIRECISMLANFDWDVDEMRISHSEALALLRNPPWSRLIKRERRHLLDFWPETVTETLDPHICRASLMFGTMKEEVYAPICHELEDNFLNLSELDFSIDPVELNDPEEYNAFPEKYDVFQVGWMAFSVNGSGYLFPWTYEETLEKLRAHPVLGQIRDICREMWPATTQPPHPEVIRDRPKMGKLWAEPQDAPFDWYWAINETY